MARRWTRILLVLTGVLAGLVLILAVFINTGIGHRTIAALAGPLSGGRVSVEGLSGTIPYSLRVQRVELRDDGGTWLVVEDASMDWSPFALLLNRVDVARFEAARVEVLRVPSAENDQSGPSFTIDIRELRIGRLETTAEVSKTPANVEVQGAVRYASQDDWSADLIANRLDANGLYRARASLGDGVLTGTVDIEEPPAGLVAGLLGLNDVGAIEVHATGSGPRDANAIALTLTAGPMRASGQGVINLIARTAELEFSANAPEMNLRPDLAWQSLSAEGRLQGSFDTPDVNATLTVRNLRGQDVSVEGVTANVTGRTGTLDFDASFAGLRLPGSEPDIFARAPITARGRIELQTPARTFSVSLSHPLLSIEAQGTAGDAKHTQADITVPRLAPFAGRGGVDLDGRATITATVDQVGDDFRIAATGTISAAGSSEWLPRLIGGNARVAVSATVSGPDIAISDARLEGAAANAQLSGSVRGNEIGLDWTLRLDDLSLITSSLVGDLRAQGQVRGPRETARLAASGVGNIGTPRIERQQITFFANAIGFPRSQSGNFSAQGRFENAPLSLNGVLTRVQGGLKATVERGTWKSLDARADVLIPENGDISGNATLRLARLNDIASVIGERIEGDVQADVAFRRRGSETSADITAHAQSVAYADAALRSIEATVDLTMRDSRSSATIDARAAEFSLPDVAAVRNATIKGRIDEPFGTPSLALAVNAPGLTAARFAGDAKAQIDGRTDAMGIRFEWSPRDGAGNAAQLSATARLDLPRQRMLFSALQAKYRGETVTLERPFTLAFGAETAVDRVLLKLANGQVSISGSVAPRLALRATAQNVSLALLTPFVPELSNEGTFSATAELSGTLANPEGTIGVQGRGLRARNYPAGVMPASLDARAVLRGRSASVNADIGTGSSLKLSVTGDVSLEGARALDLDVKGQGELSILNPMLSAEGRSLQGQMSLDLSVGGNMSAPQLSGRATLVKGEFQDVQRGVRVRDISLTAEGAGEQIRIGDLLGHAGDGTITGTGTIDFSKADIPVSFTITAQNAKPLVSDRLAVTTDANLRVTGPIRGELVVAGNIAVTRGEINLPENAPPTVVVLNVRRPGEASMTVAAETAAPFADMSYDLTVSTRGRVFVRGRGLEAELEGTIVIRGSADAPQISGGFDLRRGTFMVAGRTFALTTGRVTFDGTSIRNRIDPALDFAAENNSGGTTAKIAITGYASAPRIELSSTPTLPADEILARVLFQRSLSQLTPLQLAQLAEAAVSLASGGSGFDPLGSLRRRLGLSRLSVGSTGEAMSGTTVEAGTYVSRNVYIGARQGLEGGTQAEVQVNLTDRLKVVGIVNAGANAAVTQGSKQQDTGSSIGLSYEFQY